jgi:hypothetical protein
VVDSLELIAHVAIQTLGKRGVLTGFGGGLLGSCLIGNFRRGGFLAWFLLSCSGSADRIELEI